MKKSMKILSVVLSAAMLVTTALSAPAAAAVSDDEYYASDYVQKELDWRRLNFVKDFAGYILNNHSDECSAEKLENLEAVYNQALLFCSPSNVESVASQEQIDSVCSSLESAVSIVANSSGYYDLSKYSIAMNAYESAEQYMNEYMESINQNGNTDYTIGIPTGYDFAQFVVIPVYCNVVLPVIVETKINGYVFEANNAYEPSELGYLAVNYMTGEVMLLEDAFSDGTIDTNHFYEFYKTNCEKQDFLFTMYQESEKVDKTALINTLNSVKITGGGCFEMESYKRYVVAINNANAVIKDEHATQSEVDKAVTELLEARKNLKTADYDKSELEKYLGIIKDILENHSDEYSETQIRILSDAYNNAYDFFNNAIITSQQEIDKKAEMLKNALKVLENEPPKDDIGVYLKDYFDQYQSVGSEAIIGEALGSDFGDYKIYPAMYNLAEPMLLNERINGYIFEGYNNYAPSDFGYLAVNKVTGEVITIEDAFNENKIDIDKFYQYYRENEDVSDFLFTMRLLGDCDYNNTINVRDVTELQKSIAFQYDINDEKLKGDNVADVNRDGETNIIDVTEIQKHIVGIK